jgi:hypothetical protein
MRETFVPAMRNTHATHVDFGFLRGFIPSNPNFMPSNIDMVLERKGVFLFGEWKREEEEMKQGQKILLTSLAWHHTVILITGYVDTEPHIGLIQKVTPSGNLTLIGEGKDDLINFLRGWYVEVERGTL